MTGKSFSRALRRWWWLVVTSAALLAVVLSFWGFRLHGEATGKPLSAADVCYRTLQMFALNWESLSGELPLPLQLGRFLAAVVAFSTVLATVLQIFHEQLQLGRLQLYRGHVVVCGLGGARGTRLVEGLCRRGERVVVLESDEANEGVGRCRELGAIILIGQADDEWLLRQARVHHARVLLLLSPDDGANVTAAMLARRLAAGRTRGHLRCVLQVSDRRLRNLLHQHDVFRRSDDPFDLEFFNVYEVAAQVMLRQTTSLYGGKEPRRLLIVGLGRLGQALLSRAVRNWLVDRPARGEKLQVAVIDHDPAGKETHLREELRFLDEACELRWHPIDILSPQLDELGLFADPVDAVFVCFDNETLGLLTASRLCALPGGRNAAILVRVAESGRLPAVWREGRADGILPLGLQDTACSLELVLNATVEMLAQAIHEQYVRDKVAGGEPPGELSVLPWHELSEEFKGSNRNQAEHITKKLAAVGCRLVPADLVLPLFTFADEEVEKLARMEHDRWCEERQRTGWQWGPVRDDERRTSPHLVPWEQLPEEIKDYDRNPVRRMPAMLAKADFEIVRVAKGFDVAAG